MVDVSQHKLAPEHTKLGSEAVKDVLQEYDAEKMNLPKIKLKDPTLPEDAEPGGVIKTI